MVNFAKIKSKLEKRGGDALRSELGSALNKKKKAIAKEIQILNQIFELLDNLRPYFKYKVIGNIPMAVCASFGKITKDLKDITQGLIEELVIEMEEGSVAVKTIQPIRDHWTGFKDYLQVQMEQNTFGKKKSELSQIIEAVDARIIELIPKHTSVFDWREVVRLIKTRLDQMNLEGLQPERVWRSM